MKQNVNDKGYTIGIIFVAVLLCAFMMHGGVHAGWVQQSGAGSWKDWVKKAHDAHPELSKRLDSLVDRMNALHHEVKNARCSTCNNAAGTVENARTEMEQIYYVLAGKQPCNERKVKSIFKAFNGYENRLKWRFPQDETGKAWYRRWSEIKKAFNELQPAIVETVK